LHADGAGPASNQRLPCAAGCSRAQVPSGASPARSSARRTPGATDNTSPRSPQSGGLRPPCSGPARPEHRPAAVSRRSLQACIASLPLQSSLMSKTYLKSDHFNGGGSLELRRLHDRQVGGLRAFQNLASIDACLTICIRDAGSIAHQPASGGKLARSVACGQCMTCCQRNELFAPAKEERVGCDKQRVGPAPDRSGKRGINLSFVACVDDAELDAKRARRSASSRNPNVGSWKARVHQDGNQDGVGNEFAHQLYAFWL